MDNRLAFVQETRFGIWFLGTRTWHVHVLKRALDDLTRMLPPLKQHASILDVGASHGRSLLELAHRFHPQRLIAVDADPSALQRARGAIERCSVPVEWHSANAAQLPLPSATVDMVFCHQTLHHIVAQDNALAEFHRVLKPGGVLLLAESTVVFIRSWLIRLLFRHPMHVQRSADEYIGMVRRAGFEVSTHRVSYPFLWWSRNDLGAREWLGWKQKRTEQTLVNLVAVKPVRG